MPQSLEPLPVTPRLLLADAYTINSGNRFESSDADEFSEYYLVFRRGPDFLADRSEFKDLYRPDDQRIVFAGLQRILRKILSSPITHEEINEARAFLKNRKVTTRGLRDFEFPEQLWRRVVDEFGGYPPITIEAHPEGSVVYPGEPVIRVYNDVAGFGCLAAWLESKIIQCWAATERLTASRHWLLRNEEMIASIESDVSKVPFLASLMMHDFGDRAGMCLEESEDIGYVHLYCFPGSDTFSAAYQAWKAGSPNGTGSSVDALAHRIVQGFVNEPDAYRAIYDAAQDGDLISMVADTYDFYNAVENYILPLAKESNNTGNGKICVVRPDSGPALQQILWTANLAVEHGLYEERNGYKYLTSMRIIEGDGMDFSQMTKINQALIDAGFAPHGVLIYGVGGFLRNSISRDNFSTKYALSSVGINDRPVIKVSHTPGKTTLPSCKVIRKNSDSEITLVTYNEEPYESDVLDVWYTLNFDTNKPVFTDLCTESFEIVQNRVLNNFDQQPLRGGGLSKDLSNLRDSLINKE